MQTKGVKLEFVEVDGNRRELALCAKIAKLYDEGVRVYVWVDGKGAAAALDNLLWSFDDTAFIPHEVLDGADSEQDTQVVIGWQHQLNPNGAKVLLIAGDHAAATLAEFIGHFGRAVDMVPTNDNAGKERARQRFRAYRDAGLTPHFRASS